MSEIICPKCRKKTTDTGSCDSCGITFEKYQQEKQEKFDRVYQLLGTENFEEARTMAEALGAEFPDSKNESLLLVSNINRDINIEEKFKQALKLFDQGDFSRTVLLLRNIKAFATVLNEKVARLRREAMQNAEHDAVFNEAVEKFHAGSLAEAGVLFKTISGSDKQEQIAQYLQKIDHTKKEVFHQAVECLKKNLFDSAQENFDKLHTMFPDMRRETEGFMAIIAKKKEIKENILRVAEQAGKEGRFFEAKLLYSFLAWQYPEFRPRLAPYLEKIPSTDKISLTDYEEDQSINVTALGLHLDKDGLFEVDSSATSGFPANPFGHRLSPPLVPAVVNPDPTGDTPSTTVELSDNRIADFIY